jgi:DNA-binding SARP family transcriptional activator
MEPNNCSLCIRLFGTFDAELCGKPMARLRTRKEEWLFVLLALHPRPIERDHVASLLWPDSSLDSARGNLRRSLVELRRALGDESSRLIAESPRTIRLNLADAYVDVHEFDRLASRSDVESLEASVRLHRGRLAPTCEVEGIELERITREISYLNALEKLADLSIESLNPNAAAGYLRAALTVDPMRESLHRKLMRKA